MKINFESFSSKSDVESDLQEEFGLDSSFDIGHREPVGNTIDVVKTDDKVIIGFLNYDNDAQDYWENDDGAGELIQFKNIEDREKQMSTLGKTKKLYYLVDKYSHGSNHYSVSNTVSYPDRRWDVSEGCAVFIPCDYIQSEYKKMKKTSGEDVANKHFIKDSNSVLDNYSMWANGEVFGYTVITFDKNGVELNNDECWGYIGSESGQQEKRSVMEYIVKSETLNKLRENVVIETISKKDVDLPFRITKKDLEEIKVAHVYDTFVVGAKYVGEDNVVVYNWTEGQEKPTKSKFEEWQKKHNISAVQFLETRMKSDINEVLSKKLDSENQEKAKKPILV
jgi:hypothetical protein